jgi:hypothetical protein
LTRFRLQLDARQALIAAAGVLLVISVLPARYGEWTATLGTLGSRLIAPASHPISMLVRWVVPAERAGRDGPVADRLRQEREEFRTLWLREQAEADRLRRIIHELQQGSMYTDLPLRQLIRPVVGSASDGTGGRLQVRTGTTEGVENNTVATTAGVQLVGRVVDAGTRTSWVRLINDRRTREKIRGIIMTEDGQRGSLSMLHPIRDGLLQGPVESGGPPAEVGQVVRLDDEEWPRHSQMLLIGKIERVDRASHGWQWITVRPTVELDRVSELVLRFTPEHEAADAAGGLR